MYKIPEKIPGLPRNIYGKENNSLRLTVFVKKRGQHFWHI
jgi:hypothetical protein